jgi:AraC-like DNA-binding protein
MVIGRDVRRDSLSVMTSHDAPSDLSGLHVAIRLKADLLHKLATHNASRWTKLVLRFVRELEGSHLTDTTALVVLLTELREELRLLFGVKWTRGTFDRSESKASVSDGSTNLSRSEILARFRREILGVLVSAGSSHVRLSPSVRRAKRIIDERFEDRLTLERLAEAARSSKRQLASIFRRELAMTVHDYLTRVRLCRALELIRDGEKIEAVSLLVGYRSKKNFYHHFKRHVGVTPLAYKAALSRSRRT